MNVDFLKALLFFPFWNLYPDGEKDKHLITCGRSVGLKMTELQELISTDQNCLFLVQCTKSPYNSQYLFITLR